MFKKSLLSLLILSTFTFANEKSTSKNLEADIQAKVQTELTAFQTQQQNRLKQREDFLAVEQLLNTAIKPKIFSKPTFDLARQLVAGLNGYPLQMDAEALLLKYQFESNEPNAMTDLTAFMQKYPDSAYRKNLAQQPFALLANQQKWAELLAYSKTTSPESEQNQCGVMNASYQLFAQNEPKDPVILNDLFNQFAKLWQKSTALPVECGELETAWKNNGGLTTEAITQKAVNLFEKGAKDPLHALITSEDNELNRWLTAVEKLMNEPNILSDFIQNQPQSEASKSIALKAFAKWVKTLPENLDNPFFDNIQQWAEKLALNENEQREWKIAYLNRLFDNENQAFQQWRDEQIVPLKADNLTERRLRQALWQQTDTATWLNLLTDEGKAKLEWRYWAAKNEPDENKRRALFAEIAKERGFYAMLAAQQLGQTYQLNEPAVQPLTEEQKRKFSAELDRLQELKTLQRHSKSRLEVGEWFKLLSFEEQLAVIEVFHQRDWYDLAVEGTIQAKAFDYLRLRLPNAYSDWFTLNLADKKITKTFAQAIARQESAWNPQARSHANALGLMQLLPSTAKKTAEDNGLPFAGESDLLQPFNNIMLGTTHLNELNEKYPNNRALIAAAYNAGSSRVEKWLARSQGKLAFDEFVASIPFYETRGYVQNVLAYDFYQQVLQNQAQKVMFTKEEIERKY